VDDSLKVEPGALAHDGAKVIGRKSGIEDPTVPRITQREGSAGRQDQKRPAPFLGPKEKKNRRQKKQQREWRKNKRRHGGSLAEKKG
jgi:hypothetical protein